ncbi:hypothetical protein Tco_1020148 [Tanacetum coccineum]|uniref:Uncharacterized protein n=1 Tax=Tanacetum coccineum TaxID=301880 RepID=A0ABQ5FZ77_9ASTR
MTISFGLTLLLSCIASFPWHTDKNVSRDPFPKSTEFRADDYAVLVAHPTSFRKFQEPFLCLIGMSLNYTLDEDTYPTFLHDDGTEMDLLAFIHVADPTKVKVRERECAKEEAWLLDSIVGRVVPLLPVASARADSELEASVERFTLPFVTSSVSATPERESGVPADSITELNLCTIGVSKRRCHKLMLPSIPSTPATEPSTKIVYSVSCLHVSWILILWNYKTMRKIRDMDYKELFTEFSVGTARQACLSAEVRMRTENCLSERRRLESQCKKTSWFIEVQGRCWD